MKSSEISYTYDNVFILGDIHGSFYFLDDFVTGLPKNSLLIQVGDFGLGFDLYMEEHRALSRMDECLAEKNCKMIAIRGNHDKPSHFGANEYNLDNITFLPDYTYININGKRYLFVGGATSVDRLARKEGVDYWKSEKVTYLSDDDFNKLSPADVLILHSAPDFCYPRGYDHPFVLAYGRHDKTLIDELKVERQYLAKLVDYVKPKEVFYGHFHNCNREESNRGYVCKYTLLNINQMVKYEPAN